MDFVVCARQGRGLVAAAAMAIGFALVGAAWSRAPEPGAVALRRTTDGIPHIRSDSWRGLGIGQGYAQAQDALCTLAEAFVTFGGRRSYYFGAAGRPEALSTFGRPTNLESDFFFQAFADAEAVEAFRREQPAALKALVDGYAEGFNRYVRGLAAAAAAAGGRGPACLGEAWVQTIRSEDVYRRMIAATLAGGYARFIPEIVNARPAAAPPPDTGDRLSLGARLAVPVGDRHGIGSNMLAFGARATGQRQGVLLGNPHWYWGGPDRFYQAHLRIPGRIDAAGVAFLGIPVLMIGFNDHVAWSHTVSAARRFGLFELALDPSDPTRHLIDGVSEPMRARALSVVTRAGDGSIALERRTLYSTRFGPLIDLGRYGEAFGWGARRALAMRDVNADNRRVFRNFLRWSQARSLDEFIAIQREEAAMPWVNTAAIARGDGRVWYADIGAVPAITDELRLACATGLSNALAAVDPRTPLLDGSRSACQWAADPGAAQAGALAPARMPSLLREDYVANMNDSYWLSNPQQPLAGYPSILGGEREPLTLRGREGHRIAAELASGGARSAAALASQLKQEVLEARAYSADQFKQALLAPACAAGVAPGADGRPVDLRQACRVLRDWSNRANAPDRGALLWDAFWARLQKIPAPQLYAVPFSPEAPLATPREPKASDPRVAGALAAAVEDLAAKGWPLDAPLGAHRFARSAGKRIPLYGGCEGGYFTAACNPGGGDAMGGGALGNSYLQVVYFGPKGVEASTLLAHGQRETAVDDGAGSAPVLRYARKNWLRFPFREEEIARDPGLRSQVLRP
ncbi:penicillin acylase family protein [Variovorax sp. DT-64]|uniref:penicillin acylase family protein n=1 Tax=Variovorax sp. DT-64 TaxID=3396160 RepID=UPI003F1D535A